MGSGLVGRNWYRSVYILKVILVLTVDGRSVSISLAVLFRSGVIGTMHDRHELNFVRKRRVKMILISFKVLFRLDSVLVSWSSFRIISSITVRKIEPRQSSIEEKV